MLDAYAGTGALGIEALSRGASHVEFVDRSARAVALVTANLSACGVKGGYTIHHGDALSVLQRNAGARFDLILLDPPYDIASLEDVLAAAASAARPRRARGSGTCHTAGAHRAVGSRPDA